MRTLHALLILSLTLGLGAIPEAAAKSRAAGPTGTLEEVFRVSPPTHWNPSFFKRVHPRLSFSVEHSGNSLQLVTAVDGRRFSVAPIAASSTASLMSSLWRIAIDDNRAFHAGEWDAQLARMKPAPKKQRK